MAEAGILGEDDRDELIEGEIVKMFPIGSRHAACLDRLTRLFTLRTADPSRSSGCHGRCGCMSVQSPRPDLALRRSRRDFYSSAHPKPKGRHTPSGGRRDDGSLRPLE
jgi:hypothetical protein